MFAYRAFVIELKDEHGGSSGWDTVVYSGVVFGEMLPSKAKEVFWDRLKRKHDLGMSRKEAISKMRVREMPRDNRASCFIGEIRNCH